MDNGYRGVRVQRLAFSGALPTGRSGCCEGQ